MGTLDQRLDAKVLDPTRLQLGDVRLARAEQVRQPLLRQSSPLPERNDLLLQLHLAHEILDSLRLSQAKTPALLDKFRATFETYWEDA